MFVFFTLIAIGFAAQRIKLLSDGVIDAMSNMVVRLILPCMVCTTVVNGATIEGVVGKIPFFVCSFLMIGILLLTAFISSKLMRMNAPTSYINMAVIGFPNTGFIGYPLLLAMFPETGALAVALLCGDALPSVTDAIAALILGFVAYGLSIFFYVYAQRGLGAARTSAYYAVNPFIGAALSLALFQTVPGPAFLLALVLMALGAWLVTPLEDWTPEE